MSDGTCFEAGSVGVVDETQECSGCSHSCRRHRRYPSEYARGVADERARVVADLREWSRSLPSQFDEMAKTLESAADRYERGEHEREGA